jgi:hypothetical protein
MTYNKKFFFRFLDGPNPYPDMRDALGQVTHERKPIFIPAELAGDVEEDESDYKASGESHDFSATCAACIFYSSFVDIVTGELSSCGD